MKIKAPAYIQNGKLEVYDREGLAAAIAKLDDAGAMLEIKVLKDSDDITQMRRYFFGVVCRYIQKGLKDATGELWEITRHIYPMLKDKFYSEEIIIPETGEILRRPKSLADSAKPDKHEVSWDLIERSKKWSLDTLGVYIPDPGEVAFEE